MNLIPQDKINALSEKTGNLIEVINQGIAWADAFLKDETKTETKYELKKYRRTLKKIKAVVTEKPAFALFGASQVGKSYMANNLLYNKDNKLLVSNHLNDESIDFLKRINPEGNQNEATGVVTRFTSSKLNDPKRLPIRVKLFSVKDIICIIIDTYFQEFVEQDKKPFPRRKELHQFCTKIQSFKNQQVKQFFVSDDDVYEIQEYLTKNFLKKAEGLLLDLQDLGYWHLLADNIFCINIDNWANVFSVLWNFHQEITDLVQGAINVLKDINFMSEVYVDFDSIVRSNYSIIDVSTLRQYFRDSTKVQVQLADYSLVSITASKLSFITAEIILTVDKSSLENRPFIDQLDIIDFPGARTREPIHNLMEESLLTMMLRGKVAYLFNSYSSNYRANILSVCMRTAQTNVPSVPGLINQWIADNLGATPEERGKNIISSTPPLFIIFTWWNTQLEFKVDSDTPDPTDRIKKLFETRFSEEIMGKGGAYNWNKNWAYRNGQLYRFNNFYLLRDFIRSKEIFAQIRDENGLFIKEDIDVGFVSISARNFHEKYKEEFLRYHREANSFFADPEEAFLEASIPGKDGSEYIIRNLVPIASNAFTVPIYVNTLNECLTKVKKELDKHYHSDSADEQIRKAAKDSSNIQLKMNIVFGIDAFYFGSFIEKLILKESEVVVLVHDLMVNPKMVSKKNTTALILIRVKSKELSADKTFDQNVEILRRDYNFSSVEETKAHFEKEGIDLQELFYGGLTNLQNNSAIIADEVGSYWFKTKLDASRFNFFVEKGLDKVLLTKLFDNMKVAYTRLKIKDEIAREIREFVDVTKNIDRAEEMVAHICVGIINKFITSMGWSFFSQDDKMKLRDTNNANNLLLEIPDETFAFHTLERLANNAADGEMSVEKLVDYMYDLNENLNKIPLDLETIEYVPMVKNYRKWSELMRISFVANCDIPTYNVEANQQLGSILEKMKEYKFVI